MRYWRQGNRVLVLVSELSLWKQINTSLSISFRPMWKFKQLNQHAEKWAKTMLTHHCLTCLQDRYILKNRECHTVTRYKRLHSFPIWQMIFDSAWRDFLKSTWDEMTGNVVKSHFAWFDFQNKLPGDGIFKTLNFKIFWGNMPPDPLVVNAFGA